MLIIILNIIVIDIFSNEQLHVHLQSAAFEIRLNQPYIWKMFLFYKTSSKMLHFKW